MTEAARTELKRLAEIALDMCKADMQEALSPRPLAVVKRQDGSVLQLPVPPNLDMNDGKMKELYFSLIRVMTDRAAYSAVLTASEGWTGKPTQKLHDLPEAEARAALANKNIYALEEAGLCTKHECVVVLVQTAEDVLLIQAEFIRDADGKVVLWTDRDEKEFPQEGFHGRQKMYGPLDPTKGDIENPRQIVLNFLEWLQKTDGLPK